jgi:hypothetical protein
MPVSNDFPRRLYLWHRFSHIIFNDENKYVCSRTQNIPEVFIHVVVIILLLSTPEGTVLLYLTRQHYRLKFNFVLDQYDIDGFLQC